MTGFNYSAVNQTMTFNANSGQYFWSNGYQYGTVNIDGNGDSKSVSLVSLNGNLSLKLFELRGFGNIDFAKIKVFKEGKTSRFTVEK